MAGEDPLRHKGVNRHKRMPSRPQSSNSGLCWHLRSLRVGRHPSDFSNKKSGVILIGQHVMLLDLFPL